ncbi:MAG: hypothetical protein JRD69_10000 [Deltaproteobacteria bacterium]|nr:hypothetical protein [Deltaproteobacteria bacterium]
MDQELQKILFDVSTLENFDVDVEGYKFYKNLTLDKVQKLVDRLLREMVNGKVACFNVSLSDQAT